jgi:hypothetical protein
MAEAYAIRAEAARRLLDPIYRDLRSQLREILVPSTRTMAGGSSASNRCEVVARRPSHVGES